MINKTFLYSQKAEQKEFFKDLKDMHDFPNDAASKLHNSHLLNAERKLTFIDTVISEYLLTDKE